MKKSFAFIASVFVLVFSGCISSSPEPATSTVKSTSSLIKIDDFLGKELLGVNADEGTTICFNADNTFVLKKKDSTYNGTWSFDPKSKMYPYTMDWNEGDTKNGYIVDFMQKGNILFITGYWYLTDAMKSINIQLAY